jgi:hypothetical protein
VFKPVVVVRGRVVDPLSTPSMGRNPSATVPNASPSLARTRAHARISTLIGPGSSARDLTSV